MLFMLVLGRNVGESVIIDDEIVVTVLESKNGQIRLGFTAPKDINIYREEIYNKTDKKIK
jgi:carbon storage regulator